MEKELSGFEGDKGLKSKSKALVITSLILLGLSLTGAKIEEANTFIFKISLENQNGISHILVISIIFLLIRYNSYVHKYLDELYQQWTSDLLKRKYFRVYEEDYGDPIGSYSGALLELVKDKINLNQVEHEQSLDWSAEFICRVPFIRYISYSCREPNGNEYYFKINILRKSPKIYLRVLLQEVACQASHLFLRREYLDIYAPYLVAVLSLSSFFFSDQLIMLFGNLKTG